MNVVCFDIRCHGDIKIVFFSRSTIKEEVRLSNSPKFVASLGKKFEKKLMCFFHAEPKI